MTKLTTKQVLNRSFAMYTILLLVFGTFIFLLKGNVNHIHQDLNKVREQSTQAVNNIGAVDWKLLNTQAEVYKDKVAQAEACAKPLIEGQLRRDAEFKLINSR